MKIGDGGTQKSKVKEKLQHYGRDTRKYAEDYEIVRLLLRYRQIQKLNSTYVEGFKPLIAEGKVHTTYKSNEYSDGAAFQRQPKFAKYSRQKRGREGS